MKFSAAVLALAAGAMAHKNETVAYTTEVVTAYTTFCPAATEVTVGTKTYTVTEATTLTITDCPGGCTIKRPVTTISSVVCSNCPSYHNSTATGAPSTPATLTSVGTVTVPSPTKGPGGGSPSSPSSPPIATAGAAKGFALSGLALGLAALAL
ncbi:uncharacterized protein B0T15DRAFT_526202 [Chaetomium strumarium]|uniref:Clock-controlled protein 6 n=1 Tax=Chaetomium strumarium TaxID=1170767 RepID=A0AAJ0GZM3_9PEZI|nr:hypothetical protein B0T15DRAFT_526202 [Chaetomium strumarium]